MKRPSFEPWMGRVRVARALLACLGFTLVAARAFAGGMALEDALLRGLGAAVVCFFVGWASALWICGELYEADISRVRKELRRREEDRMEQLQSMYEQRAQVMNDLGGDMPEMSGMTPMSAPAPIGLAAQEPPDMRRAA
jgi:hypothetical protein